MGKPKEKYISENRGVDGRMGPEYIAGRLTVGVWSAFSWLIMGTGRGCL
jgi:hypothetical protein